MGLTATSGPAFKRRPRPTGREVRPDATIDFVLGLIEREALHRMAAPLTTWQPGDLGRPPLFPQAMYDIFGVVSAALGSDRRAEAFFSSTINWEPIRAALAARYPHYRGLAPSRRTGPTRTNFWRRADKIGNDPLRLAMLDHAFTQEACDQARVMGLFDPERQGYAAPDIRDYIHGDGTVLKSRFTSAPGDVYVDPETGELIQRPHDPDAGWYKTGDKRNVYGTKFGFHHARTGHTGEQIVLSIFQVEKSGGGGEAGAALESLKVLLAAGLDILGVVWDMALRGKHIDVLYSLGLISIVKVPAAPGGGPKTLNLGRHQTRGNHDATVWAIDGAAHIEVFTGSDADHVRLEEPKLHRRRNKSGGFRFYAEYRIPDDPRVPPRLRGDSLTLRLHTNGDDQAAGIARSENLRPIAQGDERWDLLNAARPIAESFNAWLKSTWRNGRAPAVGKGRQHVRLIYAAMLANFTALTAFERRTARPTGDPPLLAAA